LFVSTTFTGTGVVFLSTIYVMLSNFLTATVPLGLLLLLSLTASGIKNESSLSFLLNTTVRRGA